MKPKIYKRGTTWFCACNKICMPGKDWAEAYANWFGMKQHYA